MLFRTIFFLTIPFSLYARQGYFPPWGNDASLSHIYRNNLKNREFDKEASQKLDPERMTIADRQGMSEDPVFDKADAIKNRFFKLFRYIPKQLEESGI